MNPLRWIAGRLTALLLAAVGLLGLLFMRERGKVADAKRYNAERQQRAAEAQRDQAQRANEAAALGREAGEALIHETRHDNPARRDQLDNDGLL